MTIISKYPGTCKKCSKPIATGQKIEWERGNGASHIECPKAEAMAGTIRIARGQGYGGHEYRAGQVLRNPRDKEQILIVVSASKRYISDDGMSFGVGDDSGYIFSANCQIATAEEAAPLLEKEAEAAAKTAAENRRKEIAKTIWETGEKPEGDNIPEGDKFSDRQDIYGGGDWFVIGPEYIWYVRNNGRDGDNWSTNNIRTGGAGAIGWRILFDASLAEEIKRFA